MKDARLSDRLSFEGYDFFTEQPIRDADVYFFRMIFHDWSDKYCVKILRNTIPPLKAGTRLVINDFCLADPRVLSPFKERNARFVTPLHLCDRKMARCY